MHARLYGYDRMITEDELAKFIKIEYGRIGADTRITPREVIRDFIELLDIVYQNPTTTVSDLLNSDQFSGVDDDSSDDNGQSGKDYTEFTI